MKDRNHSFCTANSQVDYELNPPQHGIPVERLSETSFDGVWHLCNHPAFPQYHEHLLYLLHAPEDILIHISKLLASGQWMALRQMLLDQYHSRGLAGPGSVPEELSTARPPDANINVATSSDLMSNASALQLASSSHAGTIEASDEDFLQPATKKRRNLNHKKRYACGGPRCQGKQYRRLGTFQNHMTCVHQLTGFDPTNYLYHSDNPFDRQKLGDQQSRGIQGIAEPRPSMSSTSTAWSGLSQIAPSAFDVHNPMKSVANRTAAVAPDHSTTYDTQISNDSSLYTQSHRPPTPFSQSTAHEYQPVMPSQVSWLTGDLGSHNG